MIIFEHVSKFILSDVSFCIPKGKAVGVIGPSGAGKTTLLKLACGLLEPQDGKVYTFRKNPVRMRKTVGAKAATVFADIPALQEYDGIRPNYECLGEIYGMKPEEFARRYARLREELDLAAYEEMPVKTLSLGQRRRAEIGTVFLRDPELIILDEPWVGLDQNAKGVLQKLLRERKEAGATILVSSHDMEELSGICERILLLDRGELFFYGTKEMLLRKHAPTDVCELEFADAEPPGRIPNLEDLPLERYELKKNRLAMEFNSNHISAAEILKHVMAQTEVLSVTVRKGGLLDSVKEIAGRNTKERSGKR